MSVNTQIEGDPGSVESAADWLRTSLAVKTGQAADRMNDARRNADASWQSEAGDEFSACMSKGRDKVEGLEKAAKTMAGDLDAFAESLRRCQEEMRAIRSQASGAGLSISGFLIQEPGAGPVRPPDYFVGTEQEVADHNRAVATYDAHQDLIRAYNHAASEAARIDRKYATACRELQDDYTVGQHASWLLTTADILGDGVVSAIGANIGLKKSKLHRGAQDLLDDAKRAVADLQAHPERYVRRKWLFFKTLDEARLEADRLAIQGKLDEAEDLLRRSSALDDLKLPRYLGKAGKVLGPLGLGLGVFNDYQEGESTTQIAVSQGASAAAGIGAATLTGMGVGAAIGSVVPGAGTVVGGAIGTVIGAGVGAGVAIFADGAIDSLFENGPDVGKAFDEGIDALADTGGAIADGASSVAGTVGGWFH